MCAFFSVVACNYSIEDTGTQETDASFRLSKFASLPHTSLNIWNHIFFVALKFFRAAPRVIVLRTSKRTQLMECLNPLKFIPNHTNQKNFSVSSSSTFIQCEFHKSIFVLTVFFYIVLSVFLFSFARSHTYNATNSSFSAVSKYLFKCNWQIMQLLVFFSLKEIFAENLTEFNRQRKNRMINTNVQAGSASQKKGKKWILC